MRERDQYGNPFEDDLERREAFASGDDLAPYWQPRTKALAASYLLTSAHRWLLAAEQCTSLMAIHGVTQAAHDIEKAATLLRDEPAIAWDAMEIVGRCAEALKYTTYPFTDGIPEAVEALIARVDRSAP